jgi:phosphoenolpyruvate-protein phosphotransferase (PTS system enzyme I)
MTIKGIPISEGIAIGPVLKTDPVKIDTSRKNVTDTDEEIRRFRVAVEKTSGQLDRLVRSAKESFDESTADIFEAQKTIAVDPEANAMVEALIKEEHVTATHAIDVVTDQYVARFSEIDNPYLKERVADIKDVSMRTLRNFLDQTIVDFASFKERVVIVADDIPASDMVRIDSKHILAVVLSKGGRTSHSAIIARLLGIPTVFGAKDIPKDLSDGEQVIVDGTEGVIIISPDQSDVETYMAKKAKMDRSVSALEPYRGQKTLTKDGTPIALLANIQSGSDLGHVLEGDAEGIGLFRTEFLFHTRQNPPTEDEQFSAYKAVLEAMGEKKVIIRTIDIGADKPVPWLGQDKESNPFLGVRALRLCQVHPELLRTQLRALYRASVFGQLSVMFPMVTTLEELLWARHLSDGVKEDLAKEGTPFKDVPIGAMIEVPASALIADALARHVDFFSVGTNDLIQYTMAADRTSDQLEYLYQPLHPAILKLLSMVMKAASSAGIPVSVCGEMAADRKAAPLLVALGFSSLSMVPADILPMRKALKETDIGMIRESVGDILCEATEEGVMKRLETCLEGESHT